MALARQTFDETRLFEAAHGPMELGRGTPDAHEELIEIGSGAATRQPEQGPEDRQFVVHVRTLNEALNGCPVQGFDLKE